MDEPLLWAGTLVCALAAAGALLPISRRRRLALLSAALLLAPVLIAADNWESARFVELRDSPFSAIAVAAIAAIAVAIATRILLAHPRWLPLLLVGAMPFRIPIDLAGSTANLLLPLYGVLVAALIAAWLRPEAMVPRPPPSAGLVRLLGPLLGVVVALYGLQAGYADDVSTAIENVSFFLAPFAALFVLLSSAPWDRSLLRATLILLAAEGVLFAVIGFGQSLTGELFWNEKVIDGNEAHTYFRVNSLFFDPNILGRYLAVTMVLLAAVVAWGRRPDARRATFVFTVLLAGLVLTFSQTSLLALIAGVGVLVLAVWGVGRGLAIGAAAALALLGAVLALGGGGLTAETTGRTGLVSGGLELAGDRPLAGHGSGSFGERFEARFGGGDGIAVESHTEPVTVAAEQGAVGLVAYAVLLSVSVLALWRSAGLGLAGARSPLGATLLAAYAAMLVHSFGYAAFLTDPITWALLALGAALPSIAPLAADGRPAPAADSLRPAPEAV